MQRRDRHRSLARIYRAEFTQIDSLADYHREHLDRIVEVRAHFGTDARVAGGERVEFESDRGASA